MRAFLVTRCGVKEELKIAERKLLKKGIEVVKISSPKSVESGSVVFCDAGFCACCSSGQASAFLKLAKELEDRGIYPYLVKCHTWGPLDIRGTEEELVAFNSYYLKFLE